MPAPKGNINALKHGLYAKQFNHDQISGLKKMQWDDHRHEVYGLRVIGAQIFKLLQIALSRSIVDVDEVIKYTNAYALCTTSTGGAARLHANLNGMEAPFGDALSLALGDVPFDLVEKYNGT